MPDRELEREPLRDRHRERHRVVPAQELWVHPLEHDAALPRLVRQLDRSAGRKLLEEPRAEVDRPVGVVAHVGRVDEPAAAREDQTVAFVAHEVAVAPDRDHAAVVVVGSDLVDGLEIVQAVAEDRQEGEPGPEVVAEGAAGPQVLAQGDVRNSGGSQSMREGGGRLLAEKDSRVPTGRRLGSEPARRHAAADRAENGRRRNQRHPLPGHFGGSTADAPAASRRLAGPSRGSPS